LVKRAHDRKLSVARERLRMATESATSEYSAAASQVQEEIREARVELQLAQEAKHRVTVAHHATERIGERAWAGHEFPRHVEVQLPKGEIEDDLQRIRGAVPKQSVASQPKKLPPVHSIEINPPKIDTAPAAHRKHSLKEEHLGADGESSELPEVAEDNPYLLAKIRRKSR